jgi:hypothetical protein
MAQVDHRVGERLERVVHVTDAFEAQLQTAELVFPCKDAFDGPEALFKDRRTKRCLRPRFGVLRPRGLSGILGIMPRLKIALRLARQSYTPSRLTAEPRRSVPMARAIAVSPGSALRSSGDSLRLPGAVTNGAMTLQSRSQKATTLQPFRCLWPLYPRLSPPFFAAFLCRRRCSVTVDD